MSRVLFLYEPVGSGHQIAAETLESACQTLAPGLESEVLDPFGEIWGGIPALMTGINTLTLLLAPQVHDEVWRGESDGANWIEKLIELKPLKEAFLNLMIKLSPDVVVSTHDMPCTLLSELRQSGEWFVPHVSVVTDFGAHPYWPVRGVDQYLVAADTVRDELIQRGMEPHRIAVTGIPISTDFGRYNGNGRREARTLLGLMDMPTVLIISGGMRMGPYVNSQLVLDQMVQELDRIPIAFQVVIITGSNTTLKKLMEGRVKKLTHPMRVEGYVNNMPDYMTAADLLISKPGGLVTSESLAVGLPLISFKAGPGQERVNQGYVVSQGAGIAVSDTDEVIQEVHSLLGDPDRLASLRQRARAIGRPNAAIDGARIIMSMLDRPRPIAKIVASRPAPLAVR